MTESPSTFLKRCRRERGWTQRDLALRLGVGQQAVSSWERGITLPSGEAIEALVTTFDVPRADVEQLMAAASPRPVVGRKRTTTPRGRRSVMTLPFHTLTAEEFEHLAVDLLRLAFPEAEVYRNGRSGHPQGGVDVVARHPAGLPSGVQCKRVQQFGREKVREAVAALSMPVRECWLWLSRVASPQARDEVARHPLWRLEDAEDLTHRVESLVPDERLIIVEKYFPDFRGTWLGISAPSPWLTSEEAFGPSRRHVYSHAQAMVGRRDVVEGILALLDQDDSPPVLLVGQGGTGKSRLLRELSEKAAVCYLPRDQEVRREDYELLPQVDRLIVAVDDAHDRPEKVTALIRGIDQARRRALVVLATRPYGLPELRHALRSTGTAQIELPTFTLEDLSIAEAEELTQALLPAGIHPGLTRQLASLGRDCPLIIVVGAELLRRGDLDGSTLPGADQIRDEILDLFRATLTEDGGDGGERRISALKAIAAMQPFPTDDPRFREALEALVGVPYDRIAPSLRQLEEGGALLRRGTSLRVVPDLLGDVVLARACLDERTGVSTGYLDRVRLAAPPEVMAHVFRNVARVDWQVGRRGRRSVSLSGDLWDSVDDAFRRGDILQRITLLQQVAQVAPFQPQRALRLARWAHENRLPDEGASFWGALTYDAVLDELPAVLDGVAYDLDYLGDVSDLLAELALRDQRVTSPRPRHPLRVLQSLAEYAVTKPASYQEELLKRGQAWVRDDTPAAALVFDVLEPLLATEGMDLRSDGRTMTITPHGISRSAVAALRKGVVDLAFDEAECPDVRRAVRAVKALKAATFFPRGQFGREPDRAEREAWAPEIAATLRRLAILVSREGLDPVVGVAVWHDIGYLARTSGLAGDAARELVASIPTTLPHPLARALRASAMDWLLDDTESPDDESRYEKAEHRVTTWRRDVIVACRQRWSPGEVVDQLVERWEADRRGFGTAAAHAGAFVWELVDQVPEVGDIILARVVTDPGSILANAVPVVLASSTVCASSDVVGRARELLAVESIDLARQVAHAFGSARGANPELRPGEVALLRDLAIHDDREVRISVASAVSLISRTDRAAALQLLPAVRFSDSKDVADRLLAALGPDTTLDWSDLTDDDRGVLLAQLVLCPSIDEYSVMVALRGLSASHPLDAFHVLRRRVDREESLDAAGRYRALPITQDFSLAFDDSGSFREVLREALGVVAHKAAGNRPWHGIPSLFAIVAGNFTAEVMAVLDEALATGSPNEVDAVALILRAAPRSLLWDDVPFIHRALEAAHRTGPESERTMLRSLQGRAIETIRFSDVGKPSPQDVDDRDKSLTAVACLPMGSLARRFYQQLVDNAEQALRDDEDDDARLTDYRDW